MFNYKELFNAVKNNNINKVAEFLKKGINPNVKDGSFYNFTPLHYAARYGNVMIARLLLEHGADPNARESRHGLTPLHLASKYGHLEIVKLLLNHSVNPNVKDKNGWTPLHLASKYGQVEVVKLLLQYGADPNVKERRGLTPLYLATFKKHVNVIKVLLDKGANPYIKGKSGRTVLDLARKYRLLDIFLDFKERVQLEVKESRNDDSSVRVCPRCGYENPIDAMFCARCGYNLVQNERLVNSNSLITKGASSAFPTIPNYMVESKFNENDRAVLYKAKDKNNNEVIIKVFKKIQIDKEVEAWSYLNHPNIVKLYAFNTSSPFPYIVMEYVKGGSLEGKKFDKVTATSMILNVLQGLKYAHSMKVIHKNIKPSNILIDENGIAKISDWGFSSPSPQYASPEQLRGLQVDEKSDIYQVCEVYYEILTGKPPFQGDFMNLVNAKLSGEFLFPSKIDPSLKEFDELFKKCFSPLKEDRYSIDELVKVLTGNTMISHLVNTSNSINIPYLLIISASALVNLDKYNEALILLEELNRYVDSSYVINMLKEKIKNNAYTKDEILRQIEILRIKVGINTH